VTWLLLPLLTLGALLLGRNVVRLATGRGDDTAVDDASARRAVLTAALAHRSLDLPAPRAAGAARDAAPRRRTVGTVALPALTACAVLAVTLSLHALAERADHAPTTLPLPLPLTLTGHTGYVYAVTWSPDGRRLASAANDGTARIWDVARAATVLTLTGHLGGVDTVAWSPSGQRLATGGWDGTVRIWDTTSGSTLRGNLLSDPADFGTRCDGRVDTVAWSPDGRRLAATCDLGHVLIFDGVSGRMLIDLGPQAGTVGALAWSPDGTLVAGGGSDATARVWDAASGRTVLVLTGHTDAVDAVAWSPDGRRLATGSYDHSARIWDATTGRPLTTLSGQGGTVCAVAWSPTGGPLATAGGDHAVHLWDPVTGDSTGRPLTGPSADVTSLAWSPDGRALAAGSDDDTVRVWSPLP